MNIFIDGVCCTERIVNNFVLFELFRRFTCSHLAQLKFILPEAIEIKKILKHDERSWCMKPDLYITLNANAVDNSEKWKSNSSSVLLRKIFRSRLLDFFKSHPEVINFSDVLIVCVEQSFMVGVNFAYTEPSQTSLVGLH